ncbi:MAG: DUF1579 domain-containing protein [Planctomycetes bacterium]|nr:DUF1579 domain-containing protein [Planctomycetota bacterium]
MKLAAVAAALALTAASLFAFQDKPERFAYPKPDDMKAGMARWVATCKAGPPHARLNELLGDWDVTLRMYMGGPDAKPSETKGGSATATWFSDGKWLQIDTNYLFMGQQLHHRTTLGYDNFKNRYVASFVDSMQTTLNTASGLFSQDGNDLILWGTIDEPMTPEQDKTVRYIYRHYGQDKWLLEVHDMMIGEGNTRVLEFEYTRKK